MIRRSLSRHGLNLPFDYWQRGEGAIRFSFLCHFDRMSTNRICSLHTYSRTRTSRRGSSPQSLLRVHSFSPLTSSFSPFPSQRTVESLGKHNLWPTWREFVFPIFLQQRQHCLSGSNGLQENFFLKHLRLLSRLCTKDSSSSPLLRYAFYSTTISTTGENWKTASG